MVYYIVAYISYMCHTSSLYIVASIMRENSFLFPLILFPQVCLLQILDGNGNLATQAIRQHCRKQTNTHTQTHWHIHPPILAYNAPDEGNLYTNSRYTHQACINMEARPYPASSSLYISLFSLSYIYIYITIYIIYKCQLQLCDYQQMQNLFVFTLSTQNGESRPNMSSLELAV